jgi:RNA polymerase sigma factor (sigma-70 family)
MEGPDLFPTAQKKCLLEFGSVRLRKKSAQPEIKTGSSMRPSRESFEREMLPHLDAAYNLARWLTRNGSDAEDRVQDAYLRAWKSFSDFRGNDAKAWLLAIVRNTCFTWMKKQRTDPKTSFDETVHGDSVPSENPDSLLSQKQERQALQCALENLPVEFREVLVLREWDGFSYRQISEVVDIPIGTVMSRLTRARERLHKILTARSERRE